MPAPDQSPNLIAMFEASARAGGDDPFLWAKREGSYRPWSWRRAAAEARALARALTAKGVQPGDRVVILAENRPEWAMADLAIMMAGGISVPAYTTHTSSDYRYLMEHSGASAAVVSNGRLVERILPALDGGGPLRLMLTIEPVAQAAELQVASIGWSEALALGEQSPAQNWDPACAIARDDLACFIYTSGTGGNPKGVRQTHGNVLANVTGAYQVLEMIGIEESVFLSFLPLSHAYEHTAGQFLPMAARGQIYYAEGVETITTNLLEARPTVMACVPRLYEVMRQRILNAVARQGGARAWLFHKAVELGSKAYERPGALSLSERLLDRALDRLVREKVRARFGGRMRALVSGGAPLNYEVGLFFHALGLPIFQGYGQTENGPVASVNLPGRVKLHTVGPPLPGIEVKIADDGEILIRGASVMKGYWRDEAETGKVLRDGWLHTGDIGVVDEDGYLQITDRKRDIIVNSGGDNISPQRVEGVLLLEPEIGQVLVYGDRRPHLVALIVPDADFAQSFARRHKTSAHVAQLAEDKRFRDAIGEAVRRANQSLSVIERVRRFHILSEPFTIEDGMMTPTLKLKRQRIYLHHKDLLEGLYGSD
jgi:long-chain acyl-CoA synthetase